MRTLYAQQFLSHVENFMQEYSLFPQKTAWVAVSGGMDSMALLWCLNQIMPDQIKVLHFNHGTRVENQKEQDLIENFCKKNNLEIYTEKGHLKATQSNFEKLARDKRKLFFSQYVAKEDVIFTAHHLDDSFEWSLMQQLKSSHIKSSLGIPVINGRYRRPFLCVSKKHIYRLVKKENIAYCEDPSNDNIRYERNFMRKHIISNIKKRYPKYLKHYVFRQNMMAHELGLNKKAPDHQLSVYRSPNEGLFIHPELKDDFGQKQNELRAEIHRLSKGHRGKINSQIEKLLASKRSHKKGPLSFSGGVKAYMETGMIYLTSSSDKQEFVKAEKKVSIKYEECLKSTPALFYTDEPNGLEKKLPSISRGEGLYKDVKDNLIAQGLYVQSLTKLFKVLGKNRSITGYLYRPKSS
ncbi:MAG: tRNA lysidine(34) synthetase TilS [Bacteriovoracaceae bacterium]